MPAFPNRRAVAIGEAMLELAPVDGGLYRRAYAGDTFNTIWHMAQLLGPAASTGFVTRVGQDSLSEAFIAEMAADGLDVSGVTHDPERGMGLYLIELDGAERSFHYWRSASAARRLADDPAALAAALDGAGLAHLSGITLAILPPAGRDALFAVLAEARGKGTLISFDPNIRPRLWSSGDEIPGTIPRLLPLNEISLPTSRCRASTTRWRTGRTERPRPRSRGSRPAASARSRSRTAPEAAASARATSRETVRPRRSTVSATPPAPVTLSTPAISRRGWPGSLPTGPSPAVRPSPPKSFAPPAPGGRGRPCAPSAAV